MKKNSRYLLVIIGSLVVMTVSSCNAFSQIALKPSVTPTISATPAPTFTPSPSPTPACTDQVGKTQQITFKSSVMGEEFTATVYTPPCYDASLAGGYPVLYMFHGQNMDDTFWPSIGLTKEADIAIGAKKPAFMMVFPYEVHNWDIATESKFGDAVIDELIPYIESNYNVCTLRQCRAIGGLSRGGGWAMHLGLTHLEMFSSIGAHSMGWFQGDLYRVQNLLKTYAVSDFPRIYMDRGDQDYLRDSIDIYEKNLTATGVVHEYHVNPGKHEAAYWQSQVQNYIEWYEEGFAGLN
jgi:enterochelin esterase-like enzyme